MRFSPSDTDIEKYDFVGLKCIKYEKSQFDKNQCLYSAITQRTANDFYQKKVKIKNPKGSKVQ